LSNLLVGLYFALIAPRLFARAELHALIPHVEFSLMMSIMLTFSVFHLLLFPAVRSVICHAEHTREFKIVCTDNFIVHYLVPWLVFIYWLLCSPGKTALTFRNAILWTLLPVTYLLCIFIHARCGRLIQETQSLYPYPFLDLNALGAKTVLRTCLLLYSICVIAGSLVILITRLMFALFGSGHPLILI